MAGSLAPVMDWAVRTTLCSALPYPYHLGLARQEVQDPVEEGGV